MNTGFTLEGFPEHRRLGQLRAGHREPGSAGVRGHPRPARRAADRPGQLEQRLPAGRLPGHGLQRRQADPQPRAAGRQSPPDAERDARDFLKLLNDEHLKRHPGDTELARPHRHLRAGRAGCSSAPPEVSDLSREAEGRPRPVRRPTTPNPVTAGFARNCLLARRLLERGVRFVQLFNGAYAMGEGVGNWDGHRSIKTDYDRHGPILDQPAAALLTRPEEPRPARRHAGGLVHRVRPDADVPEGGARAATTTPRASPSGWPAPASRRRSATGRPTSSATRPSRTSSTIYDFHATILHLLGLDHERLTFYHNGIEPPADRRAWPGHQGRAGLTGGTRLTQWCASRFWTVLPSPL